METMVQRYTRYIKNFSKYSYFLTLLVKKEIKRKYKGSFLGILWSLLNPLLYTVVLTIVFSTVFDSHIENFPVYLLSGFLLFGYFSSATTSSMQSILASAHLINKIYVPKYILTVSKVISEFLFFIVSLLILALAIIVTKGEITVNILYAPVYLVLLFLFSCGVSLILATLTVLFRDLVYLYGVLTTLLMYASAIFYPPTIIPEKYQFIFDINPVYYYIKGFRDGVYYGVQLDVGNLLMCFLLATVSMVVGILVFKKYQDDFILYL